VTLAILLGVVDYLTGREWAISALYLVPTSLQELSERPWPEVCRGKTITERWLARNLAAFGICSKTLRIGDERAKGYELTDFSDALNAIYQSKGILSVTA
jgi:Protein of unknown function (DUF3631)